MSIKQLTDQQIKDLQDALRLIEVPPPVFMAAIMPANRIRIHKAFAIRVPVELRIPGVKDRFILDFSNIAITEPNEPLRYQLPSVQIEPAQINATEFIQEPIQEPIKKRKGRGKARIKTVPRSGLTVMFNDTDLELLEKIALDNDLTISYLVRSAVTNYLKNHLANT